MKIELNTNNMTLSEIEDYIAELKSQREHLIQERADELTTAINLSAMDTLSLAQYERDKYRYTLYVKCMSGREYHVPMDARAIATWGIKVEYKGE